MDRVKEGAQSAKKKMGSPPVLTFDRWERSEVPPREPGELQLDKSTLKKGTEASNVSLRKRGKWKKGRKFKTFFSATIAGRSGEPES